VVRHVGSELRVDNDEMTSTENSKLRKGAKGAGREQGHVDKTNNPKNPPTDASKIQAIKNEWKVESEKRGGKCFHVARYAMCG
jgi:hypothetical protein